ncbi:tetratricopeptide repeat protein [Prochlorococcus marinus]|uniref:tetratricopeptide repeat protein n=1 Tax=Prochlorococcus marinus TaxID=1219 RepID=UPI0022B346C8|nr:tetratricopeptide repeat protein [Prochlorococcus marinus]
MKKRIPNIYKFIICLSIFECFLITKSINAFFPKINEPNQEELKSTSVQIGKTAIQLIQFGQNDEAIKLLRLAIKLNPKEVDLWTSLAEAQIRSDRNYEALSSLNQAIKLRPNEQKIYLSQGSIYMSLNDPKKAKISIKKGLLINKNSERGYFQLGNAEIMLNNYKSALNAFKKSSEINANFWQSINNEGLVLYELNNFKDAISKFRSALKISNDAEPMLALAIVLYTSENKSIESLNLAKNALKSNPQYVSKDYQAQQLWGKKLQKSAQLLFKNKEMRKVVREAKKKSQ